jgi:3-oxoacyl-[acyl-carrier-protein] synthase II
VTYVSAHGPSHALLDRVETDMIKAALGERAYEIPVSSIKGVIGNPLGAAGPLQLIAAAMGMRQGIVPPTANHEVPDPACDLDYVPGQPRRTALDRALINTHGLGGGNVSMLVQRVEPTP